MDSSVFQQVRKKSLSNDSTSMMMTNNNQDDSNSNEISGKNSACFNGIDYRLLINLAEKLSKSRLSHSDNHHYHHAQQSSSSIISATTNTYETAENVLQRQFNLYRYYVSQYPELFENFSTNTFNTEQSRTMNVLQTESETNKLLDHHGDNNSAIATGGGSAMEGDQLLERAEMNGESIVYQKPKIIATSIENSDNAILPNYHRLSSCNNSFDYSHYYQSDFREQEFHNQSTKETKLKRSYTQTNGKQRNKQPTTAKNENVASLLCRCSKCCTQSDSSVWSLSEPDLHHIVSKKTTHFSDSSQNDSLNFSSILNQFQRSTNQPMRNIDFIENNVHLMPSDDRQQRYEHLSRVITPPNAFLNNNNTNHYRQQQQQQQDYHFENKILLPSIPDQKFSSYSGRVFHSDKLTQTDSVSVSGSAKFLPKQKIKKLSKNFRQQLSLNDYGRHSHSNHQASSSFIVGHQSPITENDDDDSVNNTEQHIYQTIPNSNLIANPPPIKTVKDHHQQFSNQFSEYETGQILEKSANKTLLDHNGMDDGKNEHRIPLSNNGIPCHCNRCRESRGLNLTTELLPIDAQISLHTMDNMDSFFQDSSMAELFCSIM